MLSEPLGQLPDSAGKSKLFSEIMDKYNSGVRRRVVKEKDWYLAKEFLRGNQYNVWVEGRGIVEPPRDAKWRRKSRLVYNKIRVDLETVLAYLLKNDPAFSVTPNTGDPEDVAAALVSRKVLYSYVYLLELSEKLERCGLWTTTAGAGFWKIGWNPIGGPKIPLYNQVPRPPPMPMPGMENVLPMQPQFDMVPSGETMPGGEVRVDVVSPFEFIPDYGAETIEQCAWAIHATMAPCDELKRLYPNAAEFVKADGAGAAESGYIARSLQSFGLGSFAMQDREKVGRAMVMEFWARPDAEHPNGRRVVATKNGVLSATDVPPGYDDIPFAMWGDKIIPGEFWPDGTARDAIPLQKELNKRLSQAADIANRFKMKWLVQQGSVTEEQINDVDGEVIEWTGRPPDTKSPPPFPESLVKLIEMCDHAIDDVTGAVAVLQGKAEGEQRSGRQVAYQGQYGETRVARLGKHLARFLSRAGKLILMQVSANVTDTRLAKVAGKNRQVEVFYFKGADLRDNTDVTVELGSLLGFTSAERFEKLMRMKQEEVIGADKVLDALEIEDLYPLIEDIAADRNAALRENELAKGGKPLAPPRYYENQAAHLHIHNAFRKGADYAAMNPQQKQIFDMHCADHEQLALGQAQSGLPFPVSPNGPPPTPAGPGEPGAPPPGQELGPGAPPTAENLKESGAELAQGLPPVPAVPPVGGPEQPPGV